MDKGLICYCGLYCGNCPVKAKVHPAATALRDELNAAGFGEVIHNIPGGDGFWEFLEGMAESGICVSCRDGSGDPTCAVRMCAQTKGVDMCALCKFYPCGLFNTFAKGHSYIIKDNDLLREKGMDAWEKMQDGRRARGYTYADEKQKQ